MIKEEEGQSLVEMALVLPLLLVLLIGVFDIGRVLYTYSSLHFTTQEAVRLGGLGRSDTAIKQYAVDQFSVGDSSKLQVTISPDDTTRQSGQNVTVTLQYPVETFMPGLTGLLENIQLSANSTIRVE